MPAFRVTYETVDEASLEQGDTAESGFVSPGNWLDDIDTAMKQPRSAYDMSLREAVGLVGSVEDCGRWFTETDSREDHRTGESTRYALHPPQNITAASYARLKRLLRA